MAKWYLTLNQQHQRPFSEKEAMWVKRESFTNCKSRENPASYRPTLPLPFNFALRKPRPDVCGPGKRKGAQLAHILPVWVVLRP